MDLVSAFADHLRRDRRRSVHTVRAYAATAERLVGFLAEHQGGAPDLAALDVADLRAFLASRRNDGIGNASAARELSKVIQWPHTFLASRKPRRHSLQRMVWAQSGHPALPTLVLKR